MELIVVNGFKHFIMIPMGHGTPQDEGVSAKRRNLIEQNNSPQVHES